ncbi:hypothetical protein ACWU4D_14060 [Vibrio sp. WJH972]
MLRNAHVLNILWMFVERAFLLLGGFIVTVMVARYLGPEQLGLISYGVALGAFAIAISQWGADYTIFNTAATKPKRSAFYIYSTEKYRFALYIAVFAIINIWLLLSGNYETDDYNLIALVVLSQVFLALDIYQFHYNAILKSKINAKSAMFAKVLAMGVRALFVFNDVNVIYFFIPFVIEGWLIFYIRRKCFDKVQCSHSTHYRNSYFVTGIPLVFTVASVTVYARMYEVMLANVVSYTAVGIFSISIALNYAWNFIPSSIGISLLSKPMKEKAEEEMIKGYSFVSLVTLLSVIPILCITYYIPDMVISLTYGAQYTAASKVLFVVSVAVILSTLGFVTNRMINSVSGGRRYLFKKALFSSPILIVLSYQLISQHGVVGAGVAFMLTELLNLTVFNYFFNKGMILKVHFSILSSLSYYQKYK